MLLVGMVYYIKAKNPNNRIDDYRRNPLAIHPRKESGLICWMYSLCYNQAMQVASKEHCIAVANPLMEYLHHIAALYQLAQALDNPTICHPLPALDNLAAVQKESGLSG